MVSTGGPCKILLYKFVVHPYTRITPVPGVTHLLFMGTLNNPFSFLAFGSKGNLTDATLPSIDYAGWGASMGLPYRYLSVKCRVVECLATQIC